MKKVIFLDFDGSLNTEKYQAELLAEKKRSFDQYGPIFDPEAVCNLRRIIESVPDAAIVISSSWKLEGLQRMRDMWRYRNLPGSVYDITPDYMSPEWNVDLELTDDYSILVGRGNEVRHWLKENAPDGSRYVIFDDLPDFLPEQQGHLITLNPYVGLSAEDADLAIRMLHD